MVLTIPKVERVGLFVGRMQPLHKGHASTINRMIEECPIAIVCIGSAQLSSERDNPYTIEQRMEMLRNVYADRIKIIPLKDIGAANQDQWVNYIADKITKLGMNPATDYYTGSFADAEWYRTYFHNEELDPITSFMTNEEMLSSKIGNNEFKKYYVNGVYKRLHINERTVNPVPSGTEIRTWLETRTEGWRRWVPPVNHEIVEENYPEKLKVPLD